MKTLLIILFVLIAYGSHAQSVIISGRVENKNGTPVENVSVWVDNGQSSDITDINGNYKLLVDTPASVIVFSRIGYEKFYKKISGSAFSSTINVTLIEKPLELKQATVKADRTTPITNNKGPGIVDYDIWNDDTLLIITAANNISNATLYMITTYGDTLSWIKIPEKPVELFTDCIENHYIICNAHYYEIYIDEDNQLKLYDAESIEKFMNVQEPCVANYNNLFFYSIELGASEQRNSVFKFKTNNYLQAYVVYNENNNTYNQFALIAEKDLLRRLFEEKDRVNENFRNGAYASAFQAEMDFYFAHKIVFKEIYAPLFRINNSIYIFNFSASHIQEYSMETKPTNKIPLQFGNEMTFKREIIKDKKTETLYALYSKNSQIQLCEINLTTGSLESCTEISRPFAERIKIHNNKIYFLYKDYSTDETSVLYSQQIINK